MVQMDELDLLDTVDETLKQITQEVVLLEQYKSILDQIAIVSKTDAFGTITYVNEKFAQVSGYSKPELMGKPHNIVRHPDMPAEAFKGIWQTIQNKQPWHGFVKNRRKDGSPYYLESHIFPILDTRQQIVEYISVRFEVSQLVEKSILSDLLHARHQHQAWLDDIDLIYQCAISSAELNKPCLEAATAELSIKQWLDSHAKNWIFITELPLISQLYDQLAQDGATFLSSCQHADNQQIHLLKSTISKHSDELLRLVDSIIERFESELADCA